MNLLQMAQRLHRESGRSGSGPAAIIGASKDHLRLFDWVADAWQEWQARGFELDFKFMRRRATATLAAGIGSYTGTDLAISNLGKWRAASIDYAPVCYGASAADAWWRMNWMDLDSWREVYVHSTQPAGRPLDWSIDDDGKLLIGPAPDSADTYSVRLEYLRATTTLLSDADTPDMDEDLHMLLVWRALVEVGKFDNAPDVLARASANVGRYEDNALSRYGRKLYLGGPLA